MKTARQCVDTLSVAYSIEMRVQPLGASPLLTDKLSGMKCSFTVRPSHTEAETGKTAHVTDP